MICCDKCQDKQKATHTVAWVDVVNPLKFEEYMVLCDKCYEEFMKLFGYFKGAKFAKLQSNSIQFCLGVVSGAVLVLVVRIIIQVVGLVAMNVPR